MTGPYRFSYEPLFIGLVLVAAVLYSAPRAVCGRARPAPSTFTLGLALVALPVNSPLETLSAHYLLLMHLLQNALIADWGPPLVILGLTPVMRRAVAAAGGRPLAALTQAGRRAAALARRLVRRPRPLVLRLGAPERLAARARAFPARRRRLRSSGGRCSPSRGGSSRWACSPTSGSGSSPRPGSRSPTSSRRGAFYSFYATAPRLWGISPVRDQNLAGILMNAEQTSIFFVAFAWQLLRVLAEEEDEQRRRDAAFLEGRL